MYPIPSRKTPLAPTLDGDNDVDNQFLNLPPNHPFATYYIPPSSYRHHETQGQGQGRGGGRKLQHFSSESTLNSINREIPKPNSRYSYNNNHDARKSRSPTYSLSQPLSPRSFTSPNQNSYPSLGHFAHQPINHSTSRSKAAHHPYDNESYDNKAPHPAYSRSSTSTSSTSSSESSFSASYISGGNDAIPTELTLFDQKPKQNLLNDLEFILGKKLNFPFLNSLTTTNKKEKKEKKEKKLVKEKPYNEDWEWRIIPQEDILIDAQKKKKTKKGRGVREGNYI